MHIMPPGNADQYKKQIRTTIHDFCETSHAAVILFCLVPLKILEKVFQN